MGGVIIIIGIIFSTLLWADLTNIFVWTLIFVSLSLGGLGLLDDILKIKFKILGVLNQDINSPVNWIELALFILINYSNHEFLFNLYFPFLKNLILQMGLFLSHLVYCNMEHQMLT